ncbi:unnamed protein product [Coregonus sp. 'balchen']|nr:unnamed protein product [Coregonus sp. 'balchen']
MSDVSEHMGTEDLESLMFLLRGSLPRERWTRIKSFLDVIVELEKLDRVSSEKVELIERCLRDISRVDLCFLSLIPTQCPLPPLYHSRQEPSTQNNNEPERRRQVCQNPLDVYRLQSDLRGECLIIDCVGSDGDMLEEMFSWLHFKVTLVKWLGRLGVGDTAAQQRENQDVDAFTCCIISRGTATDLLHHQPWYCHRPAASSAVVLPQTCCIIRRCTATDLLHHQPLYCHRPAASSAVTYSVSDPQDCSFRPTEHLAHREEDLLETDGSEGYPSVESVPTDAGLRGFPVWSQSPQTQTSSGATVGLVRISWSTCRP